MKKRIIIFLFCILLLISVVYARSLLEKPIKIPMIKPIFHSCKLIYSSKQTPSPNPPPLNQTEPC